jgi:hypothetical protein
MHTKHRTCDNQTWKELFLLQISYTNIETHVPSLYECVETRSIDVFDCCLSQFPISVSSSETFESPWDNFSTQLRTASHQKEEISLNEYPLHWVLFPTEKLTTERCSSVEYSSSTVVILTTKTSLWIWAWALLPRLSWSWAVLLPCDTYRKRITSITVVLFQFETYLLTLPHSFTICNPTLPYVSQ